MHTPPSQEKNINPKSSLFLFMCEGCHQRGDVPVILTLFPQILFLFLMCQLVVPLTEALWVAVATAKTPFPPFWKGWVCSAQLQIQACTEKRLQRPEPERKCALGLGAFMWFHLLPQNWAWRDQRLLQTPLKGVQQQWCFLGVSDTLPNV